MSQHFTSRIFFVDFFLDKADILSMLSEKEAKEIVMKKIKIKLNVRPIWEIGKGHNEHRSGSGSHDNRPKRQRTRQAQKSRSMEGW